MLFSIRADTAVAWLLVAFLTILCLFDSANATPIPPEHVMTRATAPRPPPSAASLKPHTERSAPQVISPIIAPSVAPVVSAPSANAATDAAVVPQDGTQVPDPSSAVSGSATSGMGTTPATTTPSQTCVTKPSSGPTAEEQWIKIMGILVPAIVAIGLGIGGFCVTLHVNSPKRMGSKDSDDCD